MHFKYKIKSFSFAVPPEVRVANSLIKQSLGGDTVLQCQVNANPMGKILWIFGKSKMPINASLCSIPTNKNVKYCIGMHTCFAIFALYKQTICH